MQVTVTYISDETEYKFNRIEDITNPENVIHINCNYNYLVSLPVNMDKIFSQLTHFDCSNNNLVSLPVNMDKIFSQLTYFDCRDNNLVSLPENMNEIFPQLTKFYCCNNKLVSLPENMYLPHLQRFSCSNNKLKSLPENMNFPLLTHFNCGFNNLISLPENMDKMFPQLAKFYCSYNKLKALPKNMDKMFPLLQDFCCSNNNLVYLPENMNFPRLKTFYCNHNNLSSLPENMNLPQLEEFYCIRNKLTSLPVCIMNWRNLRHISYTDNEIELSPQLERFLNEPITSSVTKLNVYSDTQNVHNSSIQGSVRDSINRLTTRRDLPKFDSELLNTMILTDDVLLHTVKEQLIEYCQDDSVHSLLLLTFAEVLWYVLNTISHDFSNDNSVQMEIKRVLNQEIQDAECKCFTGRMNRVVNCLNGFSPLVEVKISDSEQIGNVIVMLRDKALDSEGNYSIEKHKQLVERELVERGYDSETICQWLEYIE